MYYNLFYNRETAGEEITEMMHNSQYTHHETLCCCAEMCPWGPGGFDYYGDWNKLIGKE